MSIVKKNKNKPDNVILQVLCNNSIGGVEFCTLELTKRLQSLGHKNIVISQSGPLVVKFAKAGAIHYSLNLSSKNIFTMLYNAKKIAEIIRKHNVDIIHVKSRAPSWSCYIASKLTKTTLITSFHGLYDVSNFFVKLYNFPMLQGDKIVAVSNFTKNYIIEKYPTINPDKIVVIPDGINLDLYQPIQKNDDSEYLDIKNKFHDKYHVRKDVPVILFPSRIAKRKGHMILIRALSKILDKNFYCIMVGSMYKHPQYTSIIKEAIYKNKMQHSVQLFGHEKDMLSLYQIADIVLSISTEPEASGRIIMEAQAMKKLVIANNIGVVPENIKENYNGLLISKNDEDELAAKIEYALSILDSPEYNKITSNARKTIENNYTINHMFNATLDLYKKL